VGEGGGGGDDGGDGGSGGRGDGRGGGDGKIGGGNDSGDASGHSGLTGPMGPVGPEGPPGPGPDGAGSNEVGSFDVSARVAMFSMRDAVGTQAKSTCVEHSPSIYPHVQPRGDQGEIKGRGGARRGRDGVGMDRQWEGREWVGVRVELE